jgi:hypothetical protein
MARRPSGEVFRKCYAPLIAAHVVSYVDRFRGSMTVHRTEIERALDEIISNEEGMRFQGLAVVLAKQKWPDLVACERKWDQGLDARTPASLAAHGVGKGLACSITATLEKVHGDAESTKKHFDDVSVLIFATPQGVTNHTANKGH